MKLRPIAFAAAACLAILPATSELQAQTRPASSGDTSFYEPELKRHHGGFKYPNVETPRRRKHRAGRRKDAGARPTRGACPGEPGRMLATRARRPPGDDVA